VLVDTGIHGPESMADLDLAMAMVGLRVEDISLLVCTHAHSDHYGQAATICERAGCELWMHADYEHVVRLVRDPDALLEDRLTRAARAGVPAERINRARELRRGRPSGVAELVKPDRTLSDGVTFETDHGIWEVVETPGHSPSHVCLWQAERRLLISGDHLLGRIALYYDFGYSNDPVGEFLGSLERVRGLGARLCLAGHGRTFTDVVAHIDGNVTLVAERVERVANAICERPRTAFEITPILHDEPVREGAEDLIMLETFCYLRHLEAAGLAQVAIKDGLELWRGTAGTGAGRLSQRNEGYGAGMDKKPEETADQTLRDAASDDDMLVADGDPMVDEPSEGEKGGAREERDAKRGVPDTPATQAEGGTGDGEGEGEGEG